MADRPRRPDRPAARRADLPPGRPVWVTLSPDADSGEPIQWAFARDLLAAALHAPEAMVDIRACISPNCAEAEDELGTGTRILTIMLGPPDACARFEARRPVSPLSSPRSTSWCPAGRKPPTSTTTPSSPTCSAGREAPEDTQLT